MSRFITFVLSTRSVASVVFMSASILRFLHMSSDILERSRIPRCLSVPCGNGNTGGGLGWNTCVNSGMSGSAVIYNSASVASLFAIPSLLTTRLHCIVCSHVVSSKCIPSHYRSGRSLCSRLLSSPLSGTIRNWHVSSNVFDL